MTLVLHGYWRSSTTYRVRIGLNLKGLAYDQVPVDLLKKQNREPAYLALNPQGRVPTLVSETGAHLTQSLAILEWLDETYPDPSFLPGDALARAHIRAVAGVMATDIHALQNSGTLAALRGEFGFNDAQVHAWLTRWMLGGLESVERMLISGPFCCGDAPTLADICLIPQLYGLKRFNIDYSHLPKVTAAEAACQALPAFQAALPEAQPDATG
jgi:maleylpyruvate isomerase